MQIPRSTLKGKHGVFMVGFWLESCGLGRSRRQLPVLQQAEIVFLAHLEMMDAWIGRLMIIANHLQFHLIPLPLILPLEYLIPFGFQGNPSALRQASTTQQIVNHCPLG
ncbi:MAG: hypothetical protein DCF22_22955 [Leptolyngbya sp.]|nr:MAG: hypothetical protein DCF22_22955 [Leptolyngbya sp.]